MFSSIQSPQQRSSLGRFVLIVALLGLAHCGEKSPTSDTADVVPDVAGDSDADIGGDASHSDAISGDLANDGESGDGQPEETFVPITAPWPTESCIAFDDAASDPSQALFAPGCLLDVDITVSPSDWASLRAQTRTIIDVLAGDCLAAPPEDIFTWFHADVSVGGRTVSNVGIRKKGFLGSLSDTKPSLKLRFDKYAPDQRLASLKRMTLNNQQQDESMLSACLGYGLFAAAGIPAPRCSYARVRVNGTDLGIYAHVDSLKSAFLERTFGDADGNFYEGTLSDFASTFMGTWEKKNNVSTDDWSDIEAVTALLESEPTSVEEETALLASLGALVDMDAFYRFWAAEVLIGHWDGYAGNANNFYVYASAATTEGRFQFIPWGIDDAFVPPPEAIDVVEQPPESVMATGLLAHRLYATVQGRQRYFAAMDALLDVTWDEAALADEVDRLEALLEPAVVPASKDAWKTAVQARRSWVAVRRARIQAERSLGDPEWTLPPRESVCWPESGAVDATFQAAWGAPGLNPLTSSGTVETTVAGIPGPLGNVSSSARFGTGADELGEALIEIVAQGPGDAYVLLRVIGPPGLVAADTSHPIDWQDFRGYVGSFVPLQNTFEAFGLLTDGVISFSSASTIPGSAVVGTIQAAVVEAP